METLSLSARVWFVQPSSFIQVLTRSTLSVGTAAGSTFGTPLDARVGPVVLDLPARSTAENGGCDRFPSSLNLIRCRFSRSAPSFRAAAMALSISRCQGTPPAFLSNAQPSCSESQFSSQSGNRACGHLPCTLFKCVLRPRLRRYAV